jgi:cytochrome P450
VNFWYVQHEPPTMSETPPGPRGDPVFGSGRRYADDPFAFVTACEQAYGGVARFDLGPMETYLVTDPEGIERVLVSESDRFSKPEIGDDAIGDLLGEGLLTSEGDTWQRGREVAAPAFRMDRLGSFTDRIAGHAKTMVTDWNDGDVRDVEREMTQVTLRVICDLMLGVELDDERVQTIGEALEPVGAKFEPSPLRTWIPEWIPSATNLRYRRGVEALDEVVAEVIDRRRGDRSEDATDYLGALLQAADRGVIDGDRVRDEVMTTLLAGHDTTALALTYTWFLLSEHPDYEDRVHREVDRVLGNDRPTMADVRDLSVTKRAVEESMRLYPPVYVLFRAADESITLGDYRVPEGATVMLSQWATHRSERYWEDPDRFDPDRFAPERSADRPRFAYFPFGAGPRHCIGKHLAMLEARVILSTVARRYRLEYLGDPDFERQPTLTMHPADGMNVRVRERD